MKFSSMILPAAALTMLFAACQDEDFGFQTQDVKKAKYDRQFTETFGEIDPAQDWSMAKQVKATVTGVEDGVLEIYYKNPISPNAVLLAKKAVVGGEVTVRFDMAKNVSRVFVRLNTGSSYFPINRYFDVIDGEVNFGAITRAEIPTGASRVTKGESYSIKTNVIDFETWGNALELYTGDAADAVDFIDGYYRYVPQGDYEQYASVWRDYRYKKLVDFTNIIPLNNVLSTADERPEIFVSDIAHFFVEVDGEKPLFTEKENHVKFMKPGSVPQLQKDLVFNMKEAGPMTLDYFFKGTKFDNKFGYFYFTGDYPTPEEFITMPKYILVDNMSDENREVSNYVEGTQSWNLIKQSSFNAPSQTVQYGGIDGMTFAENTWDNKIIGTRFQLTYFGQDGNGEPSYTFPKGVKIGLFIEGRDQSDRSEADQDGILITSIAALNLKLYSDCPHAALFKHNGQVVFAMEDMWNGSDYDLNDMMFFVNAPIEDEDIPELTPVVEPKTEVWIAACEDLGGSLDYDFNDLVFGVQKEYDVNDASKANVKLIPLAAGGTLNDVIVYAGVEKGEIHSLLGSTDFTTALNAEGGSSPSAGKAITIAEDIDAEMSINDIMGMISVKCTRNAEEGIVGNSNSYNIGFNWDPEHKEDASKSPEVLVLPQGWDWPAEGVCILDVYPAFSDWTTDANNVYGVINKKSGVASNKYVTNPLQPAAPSQEDPGESGGEGGGESGETPSEPVGTQAWNITLEGPETVQKNMTAEYTVSVEGVDDLSALTITCGSYSPGVATFTYENGKFVAKGLVCYDATIYVKVAGDETHRDTRKEMHIKVTNQVPEFKLYANSKTAANEITDGSTIEVLATQNLSFVIDLLKGDGNSFELTSSNPDVASFNNNLGNYNNTTLTLKKIGSTEITVKHKEVANSWEEVVVSFTVKIKNAVPEFDLYANSKNDENKISTGSTLRILTNETLNLVVDFVKGDQGSFEFTSSNPEVASFPNNLGNYHSHALTINKAGTTEITVKHKEVENKWEEKSVTFKLEISDPESPDPVFSIELIGDNFDEENNTYYLYKNETCKFKVNLTQGDIQKVSVTSSNPNAVKVDFNSGWQDGNLITGLEEGQVVTVTVTHAAVPYTNQWTLHWKEKSETFKVEVCRDGEMPIIGGEEAGAKARK